MFGNYVTRLSVKRIENKLKDSLSPLEFQLEQEFLSVKGIENKLRDSLSPLEFQLQQ